MDQNQLRDLIPPKQQNPLLKRKPLDLGTSFLNYKSQNNVEIDNPLTAHSVTLLFFGASWCHISRPFVKSLIKHYEQINLQQKKLEIIFVSFDKIAKDSQQFTKNMPWIGIPALDERVSGLKQFYNVRAIPSLVLIDKRGEQVTNSCRQDVYQLGEDEAYQKWKKLKDQADSKY